ncbi:DUF1801 domain-containing protein [Chloroflexota bacterium]
MAAKTVTEYISGTSGEVGETLQSVREIILGTLPNIEEYMKWGVPTYRLPNGVPLFYLYGGRDHVNIGFLLGTQLQDPEGLLKGEGTKGSRHIHLSSSKDINKAAIRKFLEDSVRLVS